MPEVGTRVRVPWEMGTRDGVVTVQMGADTQKPRVRVRLDGETAEAEFPLDQIELISDEPEPTP
jgi:hypothetical protein